MTGRSAVHSRVKTDYSSFRHQIQKPVNQTEYGFKILIIKFQAHASVAL